MDLKQRALVDVDYDPQGFQWREILKDSDVNDAVQKIAAHVPMSPTGATMVYLNHTIYNEVSGIAPLYPLNYVELNKPNISFVDENKVATMNVGNYSYTEYLPVTGYNDRGAEYYGFNKSYDSWIVVDENGAELAEGIGPVIIEKSSVAGYTKFKAVKPRKCYLKYLINEKSYPAGPGSEKYTRNADLARTAVLEINVLEEKATYEISGSYAGVVSSDPENIEGDGKLEVHAFDSTGKEVKASCVWEAQDAIRDIPCFALECCYRR